MLLSFGLEHRIGVGGSIHISACRDEGQLQARESRNLLLLGTAGIRRQAAEYAEQAWLVVAQRVASHSACRDEGQLQAQGSRKLP